MNRSRSVALTLAGALCLASLLPTSLAQASDTDSSSYEIIANPKAGYASYDPTIDETHNRVYAISGSHTDQEKNLITWIDSTSNQPATESWELQNNEPFLTLLDDTDANLFVVHNRPTKIAILNTADGSTTKVIDDASILPKFVTGMKYIPTNQHLMLWDSKGLYDIDPQAGTGSGLIKVSEQKYPLVKDAVFDSNRNFLWISAAKDGIITAYDVVGKQWLSNVKIPIKDFPADNPTGGKVSKLALDQDLGYLYVVVQGGFRDNWTSDKIVTINVKDTKAPHVGETIEVPVDTRAITVNPVTHEVYVVSGERNTLSVISPTTWKVNSSIDFTEQGVTTGYGRGDANSTGISVNKAGDRIYVAHPYSYVDKYSVIARSGDNPKVNPRDAVVDDSQPTAPTTPKWAGPAAAAPATQPASALAANEGTFTWGFNEYRKAWQTVATEGVTEDTTNSVYLWNPANGWYDPSTKAASLSWAAGLDIHHYPTLVPSLETMLGNPLFTLNPDGTAKISLDVSWVDDKGAKPTPEYQRLEMLTFDEVSIEDAVTKTSEPSATDGSKDETHSVTITGTPIFDTRDYTDAGGKVHHGAYPTEYIQFFPDSMKAWWYKTGASMDNEKVPLPIKITFTYVKKVPAETTPDPAPSADPAPAPAPAPGTDPAPAPAPGAMIKDQAEKQVIHTVRQGESVVIIGENFDANQEVTFTLHSDPIELGKALADENGKAKLLAKIDTSVALGAHEVILSQGDKVAKVALNVIAPAEKPALPQTGANVDLGLGIMSLLVISGGAALVLGRKFTN